MQSTDGGFRTEIQSLGDRNEIDLNAMKVEIQHQLDRFTEMGSGWTLAKITRFVVHICRYRPLNGSSYIPTPPELAPKHAIVNVKNMITNVSNG
jgi:hypothetical protein